MRKVNARRSRCVFTYVHPEPATGADPPLVSRPCAGSVPACDGHVRYSYLVEDVTESRRLEATLRETAERYRGVVAAPAEGVVLHDAQGGSSPAIPVRNGSSV